MFSIISLNAHAGAKFTQHAEKVAIASALITLVAGLFIYNLMGGARSFLPKIPAAGYVVSGVALLFLVDTIRYAVIHYKKSTLSVASPPLVSEHLSSSLSSSLLISLDDVRSNIDYDPSWTIAQLKNQIAMKLGIPGNSFSLLCAGKTLADDQLLVSSIDRSLLDGLVIRRKFASTTA